MALSGYHHQHITDCRFVQRRTSERGMNSRFQSPGNLVGILARVLIFTPVVHFLIILLHLVKNFLAVGFGFFGCVYGVLDKPVYIHARWGRRARLTGVVEVRLVPAGGVGAIFG